MTTNQSIGVQSHQIILMVTLVDPTTFTSSVNSTEGAELREIVIGEVRLVRTMLMAFVEATTTMTVVLRVDKTGLGWILLIRVVAFGLAHPDNARTLHSDGTGSQTTRQGMVGQHPTPGLCHGLFKHSQ